MKYRLLSTLALVLVASGARAQIDDLAWLKTAIRSCSNGAVTAKCRCGTSNVTTGYCCSGVSQSVGCSLLAVSFSTQGCQNTGTVVGAGGEAMTYSRSGSRTCNVSGTIQTCTANQFCVEIGGLLVEPARSNVVLRPLDFSHGFWNYGNSAFMPVYAYETGLDGAANTGALIQADTTNNRHFFGATNVSLGVSGTNTFAVSYHAKSGTASKIAVLPENLASYNYSSPYIVAWDLSGSGSFIYDGATAESIAYGLPSVAGSSGWFRPWATSSYTGSTGNMNMILVNQSTPTTTLWTTAGTENFHIWGPQVEVGTYPTSFIPASGSVGTRAAEVPSVPWPSAAAVAPCVKATVTPTYGRGWSLGTSTIWSTGTSGGANSAKLTANTSGNLVFDVYDGSAAVKTFTAAHGYADGVTRTIEACALGGTLTITSDGSTLSGSSSGAGSGTWSSAPSTLYIGTLSSTGSEAGMSISSISVRGE